MGEIKEEVTTIQLKVIPIKEYDLYPNKDDYYTIEHSYITDKYKLVDIIDYMINRTIEEFKNKDLDGIIILQMEEDEIFHITKYRVLKIHKYLIK